MQNPIIKIRAGRATDWPFVFATWLRQLWFHRDNKTTLPKETFMRLHHARIEKLLESVAIEIACLSEDDDVILGYTVLTPEPFIYLKKAWRGLDIEKLFKEKP